MTFATLGVLGTTQDVARTLLQDLYEVEPDPDVVAEETLCMLSTATARAASVALQDAPDLAAAAHGALLDAPMLYRDYLVGGAMIVQEDASLMDANEEVYQRLQRKREFYQTHLPEGQFPGPRALKEKLPLWMGRVSPPGLPETPIERLKKLDLTTLVSTHLKLVLAYGRRGKQDAASE